MKIQTYAFYHREAADRLAPKKFVDALIATGRFWRDEKGLINFKVGSGDYVRVSSGFNLQQILEDGEALIVTGDLGASCFSTLWLWASSRKHSFPRLNPERPYNPDAPPGVAHVPEGDRYGKGGPR
jgi:hypothetical protein